MGFPLRMPCRRVERFSPVDGCTKQHMQQELAARKEVLAVLISGDGHAYSNTIPLVLGGWAGFPRPVS